MYQIETLGGAYLPSLETILGVPGLYQLCDCKGIYNLPFPDKTAWCGFKPLMISHSTLNSVKKLRKLQLNFV
jgi:hypothetical protein